MLRHSGEMPSLAEGPVGLVGPILPARHHILPPLTRGPSPQQATVKCDLGWLAGHTLNLKLSGGRDLRLRATALRLRPRTGLWFGLEPPTIGDGFKPPDGGVRT